MTARPKELCLDCREYYSTKDDIKSILYFKACIKCMLEKELGHKYTRPMFKCSCGNEYAVYKNLWKHSRQEKHTI